MNDFLTIAGKFLQELCRSDADGHCPHWAYLWLTVFVAHNGLGMMVALTPLRKFAGWILALYVAKELGCDLRLDGYAMPTWIDSAIDVFAVWLGYAFASRSLRKMAGQLDRGSPTLSSL